MANPFKKFLNNIANNFSKEASNMLIITGVAAWVMSSLAQIGAVLFNTKISKDQKSFLIPQECADAVVNIGSFFLITQGAKKYVTKLFSTGKIAPNSVRKYIAQRKDLYADKVGKIDFDLDKVLRNDNMHFPKEDYWACKNLGTTIATIGAGILSSNVITPIVRNNMASGMQQKYLNKKYKTEMNVPQQNNPTFKSYGMRI